jgi:hypothetical protein
MQHEAGRTAVTAASILWCWLVMCCCGNAVAAAPADAENSAHASTQLWQQQRQPFAHLMLCVVVVRDAIHVGLWGHGLVEGRVKHTNLQDMWQLAQQRCVTIAVACCSAICSNTDTAIKCSSWLELGHIDLLLWLCCQAPQLQQSVPCSAVQTNNL